MQQKNKWWSPQLPLPILLDNNNIGTHLGVLQVSGSILGCTAVVAMQQRSDGPDTTSFPSHNISSAWAHYKRNPTFSVLRQRL
eukprot:2723831-Ditylum_brightwellii.AAC.1